MTYWNMRPVAFGASISADGSTYSIYVDWAADTTKGTWSRRITTLQTVENVEADYLERSRDDATVAIEADGYALQP